MTDDEIDNALEGLFDPENKAPVEDEVVPRSPAGGGGGPGGALFLVDQADPLGLDDDTREWRPLSQMPLDERLAWANRQKEIEAQVDRFFDKTAPKTKTVLRPWVKIAGQVLALAAGALAAAVAVATATNLVLGVPRHVGQAESIRYQMLGGR